MVCLPLTEVKAGMMLAKSIVGPHGDLLLAAGFVINDRVLEKMQSMALNGCWVHQDGTESIVPEEKISEQLALQTRGALRENATLLRKAMQMRSASMESVQK